MKKTYEKPELQVEAFVVEDVITVSAAVGPNKQLDSVGENWQTPGMGLDFH